MGCLSSPSLGSHGLHDLQGLLNKRAFSTPRPVAAGIRSCSLNCKPWLWPETQQQARLCEKTCTEPYVKTTYHTYHASLYLEILSVRTVSLSLSLSLSLALPMYFLICMYEDNSLSGSLEALGHHFAFLWGRSKGSSLPGHVANRSASPAP